jgi:arylsulfatase A-like enzyme
MHPSHGHDQTIINGISRIGYMAGGVSARWTDEDMADVITERAETWITGQDRDPFFLFFSTHDIHVPRVPHQRFAGLSGMGARGDVILQFDWCVGAILDQLDSLQLRENTLVILTSDNGPVIDDGYHDQAVEMLGDHTPSGPFRGGKYSAFEAGTRVPFIVRWPGVVEPGVSDAMVSQIDLMASLAAIVGAPMPAGAAPDSFDESDVLLGQTEDGRHYVVEHAASGTLSIISEGWKYIEPSNAPRYNKNTNIELGNDTVPQLYHLEENIGERQNLARKMPEKTAEMAELMEAVRRDAQTREP